MRKRSKYRPKPVMSDPLALLRPAPKEAKDALILKFLSALDSMAKGKHPGEEDWRLLSDAVNTIETLTLGDVPKLVGSEVMPVVNAAIEALVHAAKRYRAGQGMRLDAPGLEALRDLVDIYRQCLDGLTEREMAMAQAETQRRMNQLLRHGRVSGREVVSV